MTSSQSEGSCTAAQKYLRTCNLVEGRLAARASRKFAVMRMFSSCRVRVQHLFRCFITAFIASTIHLLFSAQSVVEERRRMSKATPEESAAGQGRAEQRVLWDGSGGGEGKRETRGEERKDGERREEVVEDRLEGWSEGQEEGCTERFKS
ncbi:hypothetical protein EYF80_034988 [Liparis tanakae]|uniref:Transmembrane protein n=1 Tax=Liparis tanakae TaxID=230148 RepID=A0A4Z2GPZ4_9TELE|nr:hypothetical protein EYF80_034988 [Liparis tanakae]